MRLLVHICLAVALTCLWAGLLGWALVLDDSRLGLAAITAGQMSLAVVAAARSRWAASAARDEARKSREW